MKGGGHTEVDALVVGMGFGGLGAALRLAERGANVAVFERLMYPGGCACTFEHEGDHFEGGATLFSGFDEGQLFRRMIDDHKMGVGYERLDPPLELRTSAATVLARRDRAQLLAQFEGMDGAPVRGLRRFFKLQEKVASALWPLLDDASLLPPLTPMRVWQHALRLPRYLPLATLTGRTLWRVLERYGLTEFTPLVSWLDSQCQITIQCGVREAEAPFALAALDYHHRGAVHVKGGIGELAWGMARAVEGCGGTVKFGAPVRGVKQTESGWTLRAGGETFQSPHVVFNCLPQDAARIAGVEHSSLDKLGAKVRGGWSAGMLFRTVRPPRSAGPEPRHIEAVMDETAPFLEGNHVFLSIGAEGEGTEHPGLRRVTASTHMDPARLRGATPDDQKAYVDMVHTAMRATIAARVPEWNQVVREFTGSPRTFAKWTGRAEGLVGGIPRRAGLRQYGALFPTRLPKGFHLVGDSVFPGQSTLAAAAGGTRVAEDILGNLGFPQGPAKAAQRRAKAAQGTGGGSASKASRSPAA